MKKSIRVAFILAFLLSSIPALAQRNNEEFRATWVITWEHISGGSSVETNKARVRQILDNHQAANMNAVIWQARQGGTAYYNSSYEPWGYYAGGSDPGYDPLAYAIEEAHKRGMELHAWFNCFATSSTVSGAPVQLHPEWVCRDQSGIVMQSDIAISPGMKAVRDYTVNVAMEIVNNYDIDGLHLDYVRWNEYTNSKQSMDYAASLDPNRQLDGVISEEQIRDLTENKGGRYLYDVDHPYSGGIPDSLPGVRYSSWESYWRDSVTRFVKALHDSIQAVKPWVRLSPAALGKYNWSGWQGYGSVYQDAAFWFNKGYVDQLTPMHYHWTTGAAFIDMLTGNGSHTACWGPWIQEGIAAGRMFSVGPGSYILDENGIWYRHKDIVKSVRTIDWVDGFQFFSYGSWRGNQYWDEAGHTFFRDKTKMRNSIPGASPAAPSIALIKQDDLKYETSVAPNAATSENQWFVIYRSEVGNPDVNQSEIVNVHFGTEAYTFVDSFPGTQDFNGNYTYAATMLDRFWNESALSNSAISDLLPSAAPVIVSSNPIEDATIPVNSSITVTFSKTMDQATIANAVSIEPATAIEKFIWSDDWQDSSRTVTIDFAEHFYFDSTYALTLNANLTDVNGVSIDGNGDGIPGDTYTLNFRTLASDLTGPRIVYTYPTSTVGNFNYDEVLTVIFDEIVDPESINENTISLTSDIYNLSYEAQLTTYEEQSVLSIKSNSSMVSDANAVLHLGAAITDTLGNTMGSDLDIDFRTDNFYYSEILMVDNFSGQGAWWDPSGSGSTTGTLPTGTKFGYKKLVFLPSSSVRETQPKSGFIQYQWDTSVATHLLRDHIDTSTPTGIHIDTSYTLQCYVFGDGSNNYFRFSLYEKDASGANTPDIAEVSQWVQLDWIGWKLVEWDLGDLNAQGEWLGNGIMDGAYYVLEGLHMTMADGGAESGLIYFDNLRLIKKTAGRPPLNSPPVLTPMTDTWTGQGQRIRITPTWTDPDPQDIHSLIAQADTSAIAFLIQGNTSGSRLYIIPDAEFFGDTQISIIVKDYGIGELADTTRFILTVTEGTAIGDENALPQVFTLSQNYPNPFNPTTMIHFSIPEEGQSSLLIFNMVGVQVAELVNQYLQPGEYHIVFDASQLPSGHYIYQLRSRNQVMNKKLLLLK